MSEPERALIVIETGSAWAAAPERPMREGTTNGR